MAEELRAFWKDTFTRCICIRSRYNTKNPYFAMPSFDEWKSSYVSGWKKSFDYKSKSCRIDIISFLLINIFLYIGLQLSSQIILSFLFAIGNQLAIILLQVVAQSIQIFLLFILLGGFVAGISLVVRRLRDMGRGWFWVFLYFLPFGNLIFGIWILVTPSKTVVASSHSD